MKLTAPKDLDDRLNLPTSTQNTVPNVQTAQKLGSESVLSFSSGALSTATGCSMNAFLMDWQ